MTLPTSAAVRARAAERRLCSRTTRPGHRSIRESCVPSILDKVLRIGEGRILKKLSGIADQVNKLEPGFADLSAEERRQQPAR